MKLEPGKIYKATAYTTWYPHELVRNPNRKWWQIWKPRYVWIKSEPQSK